MTPTPIVTFYFDPVSPYAWLAANALDRIEAAGAQIVFQPVLFAALLNAHGNIGPAEVPAKRAYIFRDVMREAARAGLAIQGPAGPSVQSAAGAAHVPGTDAPGRTAPVSRSR